MSNSIKTFISGFNAFLWSSSSFRWTRLTFFIVILFLLQSSCTQDKKKDEIPSVLLNVEQMEEIILDIHLAEGTLNFKRNIGQNLDEQKNLYFDQLFREHGVNQRIFEQNLLFYNRNPKQMDVIYDSVIKRLERMQENINLKNLESAGE